MCRRVLLSVAIVLVACGSTGSAARFQPLSADGFFVTPGEPATLSWKVENGKVEGPVEFTVRDYTDKAVASGEAKPDADGTLRADVKLAQGFYEIELRPTHERFGIVALKPAEGPADPFFAVDAAMSWLVRDDGVREGLVKALRRSRIGMSRERLTWRAVHPAADQWDWETPVRFDTLRRAYQRHGVEVLEMFHDSPAWMGLVGKYPDDLVAAARSWREIGRHWRPTWGAIDVWNEPDIFFGGNLPADQYVPLVKTVAWAFAEEKIATPIVGGVVAHHNRRFLDCAARNGLLDCCDAFSFHTYGRAPEMEKLVADYRAWLGAFGRPSTPLWLTECGRPWRKGPDRPPADQDAESALDITMKAVEARACGVARYFAFVYPFYEENANNFGLMGRESTPLRSMAAYARLASLLSGTSYLGDLACDDRQVQRARVFGDERQAVAAIYTGRADASRTVKLGLAVTRCEGIDGRELKPAPDGAVHVPDGLVYVWLDRREIGPRLVTGGEAMRLDKIRREAPPRRDPPSPVVLRLQWDAKLLEAKTDGYHARGELSEKLPLAVRVVNLSDKSLETDVRFLAAERVATFDRAEHKVTVAGQGHSDVEAEIRLPGGVAPLGRLGVTVEATGASPLYFELVGERKAAAKP